MATPSLNRLEAVWRWLGLADLEALIRIATEGLARYKLRTALSVLGVVIGVAAVTAMMSVSEGGRRETLKQVELLGLENIVVRRGGLAPPETQHRRPLGLRAGDGVRLRQLVPAVTGFSPLVQRYLLVSGPARSIMAPIVGVTADHAPTLRLEVVHGRLLHALDDRSAVRVCVLGEALSHAIFAQQQPVGRRVRIGDESYQVVGLLKNRSAGETKIGNIMVRDFSQVAIVPISALFGYSLERNPNQPIDELWLRITEGERVMQVGPVVVRTLRALHDGADDVDVIVPRELLNQRYRVQRTFNVVIGSVAILSLLVGGIGIMNIMLTSVLERTREIGIRRACGATQRVVALQFLTESLLMTLSGGALGLVVGALASWVIAAYAGWPTWVSPVAVLAGTCVSVAVGLVFGIYPATRAARVDPIEALRYE